MEKEIESKDKEIDNLKNVDEIETRILNGDGANWIKATSLKWK